MEKDSVNFLKLYISDKNLDHGFYMYETLEVESFEHNDAINDWLIEHIRRFNSTVQYLVLSLSKMNQFATLLLENNGLFSKNQEQLAICLREHRFACRDAAINIDIVIEKIKEFCRYYFFMDRDKTDNSLVWAETLAQYKDITEQNLIEEFIKTCTRFSNDKKVKFIVNIRNREIHNESPFELIHYKFDEQIPTPMAENYIISNESLHNNIVYVVKQLIIVIESLQRLLDDISPKSIWDFIDQKELKNTIKPEERYKRERDYVSEFNIE